MSNIIRLNSPVFPDGISIGISQYGNIAVVDFLSQKSLSSENEKTESVFAVALTKQHLQALRDALEEIESLEKIKADALEEIENAGN